jgi:hypothetical protein
MTPEQVRILIAAFSGFHQDFDLVDLSERDALLRHARGLDEPDREPLYAALDAFLSESGTGEQFRQACRRSGAHYVPARQELESFVAWARTAKGAAEIAAPGPRSTYVQVQAHLNDV